MVISRGLLVREPWASLIVAGKKCWEIRGRATQIRGPIAIIAAGSGCIIGTCEVCTVKGPLSLEEYTAAYELVGAQVGAAALPYPQTYAWVMGQPRQLAAPVPYHHPLGAVIWVKLATQTQIRLQQELALDTASVNRLEVLL